MPRFKVLFSRRETYRMEVEITAKTEEDAHDKAEELLSDGEIDFTDADLIYGDEELVSVERI